MNSLKISSACFVRTIVYKNILVHHRTQWGGYLPDAFQGLGERAFCSALELLKTLPTATLLLPLLGCWSCILTHLHTQQRGKRFRQNVTPSSSILQSKRGHVIVDTTKKNTAVFICFRRVQSIPVCRLQAECADDSSVSPHTDSSERPWLAHFLPDRF